MKKLSLVFPLLLVVSLARAQTITNTSGVPHTLGTPSGAPSTYGSWLRYDKTNKILYRWTGSAWTATLPGAVADGDKGDITVSGTGTNWQLDASSVGNTELAAGTGGFYKGSGTIPSGVGATVTDEFAITRSGGGDFRVNDTGAHLYATNAGGLVEVAATDDGVIFSRDGTGDFGINSTGIIVDDTRATPRGVEYSGDYSATYTDRSLVDFGSVKGLISDSLASAGGDGNGIYDGSGTVPSGAVASGRGYSFRSIVPVDGFSVALRFDTAYFFSSGSLANVAGASLVGSASLGSTGGFLSILSEDREISIGSQESDLSGNRLRFTSAGCTFTDATTSGLGIAYAADYSSTISANDRSIPDVGTVKELAFGSSSAFGLTATTTLDFPSTAAGTSSDLTITVTGATDGNPVIPGYPNASTLANGSFSAWVSAANTVTIRFTNNSSGALNPASGTFRATVLKY